MDFFTIVERSKRGELEVFPDFQTGRIKDLLGRGKSFYAIWDEEAGLWSTDENDVQRIVDDEIWKHVEEIKARGYNGFLNVKTMKSNSSGMWNSFVNYMRRFPDSKVQLDNKICFLDSPIKKNDYASKKLSYELKPGDYSAWDKLVGTLYDPNERQKIEWAIGAIVAGDSKKIEKFFVFYGDPGTGKGTIVKVIRQLFEGYCIDFDSEALGSKADQFSLEPFTSNPLVAVDTDGNLNRIESNVKLNKIVSHEPLTMNEKGKPRYSMVLSCFLFICSNSAVKITDAKSGIKRRLIDINPSGRTFKSREYDSLMSQIDFELGAIAYHCLEVYRELGKNYYKHYESQEMIMKTDVFYNFVEANLDTFIEQKEGMNLTQAYAMYKDYCEDSYMEYKLPRYRFREELKNYYKEFIPVYRVDDKFVRSWYRGFLAEKFEPPVLAKEEKSLPLVMEDTESKLDILLADCPAQYAVDDGSGNEKPEFAWGDVKTTLKDLDTRKTHYVMSQKYDKHLIFVDFDKKNEKGEKDALLNAEAASKWKPTYSEYSKGGCGIHLHYIYDGDVDELDPLFEPGVEIKVMRGKAALRRRLSKCNNLDIAHLPVGSLPLKEKKKMIDVERLKDEKHLRNLVYKALRKEINGCANTKPAIDFIKEKLLDQAYEMGMSYDLTDIQMDVWQFAANSTNNSKYCLEKFNEMKFISDDRKKANEEKKRGVLEDNDRSDLGVEDPLKDLYIFDIEIYRPTEPGEVDADGKENPGLFLVCYKEYGEGKPVHSIVNGKPHEIEDLVKLKLGGYNNLKYDNPMLYYRILGYNNARLYDMSNRIINDKEAKGLIPYESKSISFLDVLDFCSEKKSLKKWEIELGISHIEMSIPWDQPAPQSMWSKIIEYCSNDVIATEAVLNHRMADLKARQILADIAGGKINDTTNNLTTRFIFGKERHPKLVYTDLATGERSDGSVSEVLGAFPGYKYVSALESEDGKRHNMYRGIDLGFGGYTYSEPGVYTDVALLDVKSLHPSSMVAMKYFGEYTQRFKDILDTRLAIKDGNFDKARKMFDGSLAKYLDDESQADGLAQALKIAINSCYGLTSASFENAMRDKRNINNIVALRGALFMKTLLDELHGMGIQVVHLKVDSIKLPNATPETIKFCMEFARKYGYEFDHEATYDRMCLIDKAQYVAAYKKPEECEKMYGYIPSDNKKHFRRHNYPWTTTGDAFQHPYIFKTLFSGEEIEFKDMCETKSVKDAAIYLDMNEKLPDVSIYEKELSRRIFNAEHDETKRYKLNSELCDWTNNDLEKKISSGHCYQFVGRVGSFYPIRSGCGGGILLSKRRGKFDSMNGSKGYRWLESEAVKELGKEEEYDPGYFDALLNGAIKAAEEFCVFEDFVDTSKPYCVTQGIYNKDDPPWDEPIVPCGDGKYNSCMECPNCKDDVCKRGYSLAVSKE